MASMRNGSGDEYSVVFSDAGAYVRGFDHESPMSPYAGDGPWPGVLDEVPEVFRACVEEPAFCDEDGMPVVTACMWRRAGDDRWQAAWPIFRGTSRRSGIRRAEVSQQLSGAVGLTVP